MIEDPVGTVTLMGPGARDDNGPGSPDSTFFPETEKADHS